MPHEQVAHLLREKFNINPVDIVMLDGLSNQVFKVTDKDGKKYMFKILSYNPEEIFRLFEQHAIEMSKGNDIMIYNDEKHRLENFIDNEVIQREEFLKEPLNIFQLYCIARFNKCHSVASDKPNIFYITEKSKGKLWQILKENASKIEHPEARDEIERMLDVTERVYEHYRARSSKETLVLSHGDCYYRNYLYSTENKQLFLIDFEYAGYNPLGMDVVILNQEYMVEYEGDVVPGLEIKYNDFPNDDSFRRLYRFYLFFYKHGDDFKDTKHTQEFVDMVESDPRFKAIPDEEIESLIKRIGYFGVLTQIFFFFWALYLFKIDGIDFDYVSFAKLKYEMLGYFLSKDGIDIKKFENGEM